MYAFLHAILSSLFSWLSTNASKGKLGQDAKTDREPLQKAGTRIRDYLRLRGMQPRDTDSRIKPD